jgi:hypothetical protein
MFILRSLAAVGVAVAFSAAVVAAPNPAKTRSASGYSIQGTIVQIHHARTPRNSGWIKIRRSAHHRSGQRGRTIAAVRRGGRRGGQTVTIAVNSATRFQRMGQGKGRSAGNRVHFNSIRTGERVRVLRGSGQRHSARVVEILTNSSRNRRSVGNRSYSNSNRRSYGRRYRGNSLMGSRVLVRLGRKPIHRTKRTIRVRTVVRRPVRHPLIHGRVAARHATAVHRVRHTIKHAAKPHKATPHKRATAVRHTSVKHAAKRPHPKARSSSHRKR